MDNLETATRGELIKIVYKQQQEIEDLKEQINLLKVRLTSHHKNNPPSFVKPNKKNKTHKKRKRRANGYGRTKSKPDQKKIHMMDYCPHCSNKLTGKASAKYTRETIDIPLIPAIVTEHIIMQRTCNNCGKTSWPEVKEVLGKGRFTINIQARINTLKEELRQPIRAIKKYLKIFYNLTISRGEIIKILHNMGKAGKEDYKNLQNKIRGSPVVNADETGGRENGVNGYWWGFSNDKIRVFLYRKTRSGQIVKEALGENYEGIVVSDFYAGYNIHFGFHQRCWSHLLKDIANLARLLPKNQELQAFKMKMKKLYREAKEYPNPEDNLQPYYKQQYRLKAQEQFKDKARILYKPYLERKNHPLHTISKRMDKFLPELFTFVADPNVPGDNNQAERALRHLVISRKISGGTRSERGSRTKEILASLFATWRLQEKNPFQECRNLLLNYSRSY